jgi:hypothetical protein
VKTPRNEREANEALATRQPAPTWTRPGKGHVYVKPTLMGGLGKTLSMLLRGGAK